MDLFLALLSAGWTLLGAFGRRAAAGAAIDDAILELKAQEDEYTVRIGEVEKEEQRKLAQADVLIADEQASAAAQITAEAAEKARQEAQKAAMHQLAVASFMQKLADLDASKVVLENRRAELIAEARARHVGDEVEIAARIADIDANIVLEQAEIDRKISDLVMNKDAAIAKAISDQEQLLQSKDETLAQLQLKAALEDAESIRKVAQIEQYRDEALSATRDDAILVLNQAGTQNQFQVGAATEKAFLEKSVAEAQASAGGVRVSGTPLMAMQQSIRRAQEEADRMAAEADYTLTVGASRLTANLTQYRTQAAGNIENTWAANIMFDADLDMQRQRAETQFTQTYANLEATKADIQRQYTQDYAAYEAEKTVRIAQSQQEKERLGRESGRLDTELTATESGFEYDRIAAELAHTQAEAGVVTQQGAETEQYTQQIADLQAATAESKRKIEESLAKEVLRFTQTKEDIVASANFLTDKYNRSKTELSTEYTTLGSTKAAKQWAAFWGSSDILTSATSLLTAGRNYFAQNPLGSEVLPSAGHGGGGAAWVAT